MCGGVAGFFLLLTDGKRQAAEEDIRVTTLRQIEKAALTCISSWTTESRM